jgi:hypothetical protein
MGALRASRVAFVHANLLTSGLVLRLAQRSSHAAAFAHSTGADAAAGIAATAKRMSDALRLLDSVYSPVSAPDFPRPLPTRDSGKCANGDRRYLWTDAFAVIAYTSFADALERAEAMDSSEFECAPERYRRAANLLIDAVHAGLGAPRSASAPDAMRADESGISPTGFVGLRIGKLHSAAQTDAGMALDGQYWHYIDKWLLALVRAGRADDAAAIAKVAFPPFFDAGPAGDGRGGGIRWKLSVDASAPPFMQRAYASDDALLALVVFGLIEHHRSDDAPSLAGECLLLREALRGYAPGVTHDPLGWGLEALVDDFVEGHPRTAPLKHAAPSALDACHLGLPFRLYGAVLGAIVAHASGRPLARTDSIESLLALGLEHERNAMAKGGSEDSSINRVMLAACLLAPGAFARREGEPLVRLG